MSAAAALPADPFYLRMTVEGREVLVDESLVIASLWLAENMGNTAVVLPAPSVERTADSAS